MEHAYEMEYHATRMSAEAAKERYYVELNAARRSTEDHAAVIVAAIDRLTRAVLTVPMAVRSEDDHDLLVQLAALDKGGTP